MHPGDYDAWYATPRGRWVGETEYALAARLLKVSSAIFLPAATPVSRSLEPVIPAGLLSGGLLLVSGEKA